jgi:hypothetical protein
LGQRVGRDREPAAAVQVLARFPALRGIAFGDIVFLMNMGPHPTIHDRSTVPVDALRDRSAATAIVAAGMDPGETPETGPFRPSGEKTKPQNRAGGAISMRRM